MRSDETGEGVWQGRTRGDLEATVLGELEAIKDGLNGMTSISVMSHILIDTLNTNLKTSAAIGQHL